MPEFLNQPWVMWVVAGAGLFLAVRGGGDFKAIFAAILKFFTPSPSPAPGPTPSIVVSNDAVSAYIALAESLHDCPEGLAALKQVWPHLEPGHVHEKK